MRILQLGKFYPIRGGVEKVMWDLTHGLDAAGVSCDMLCASTDMTACDPRDRIFLSSDGCFRFPGGNRVIRVKAIRKLAATMISPAMVHWVRKHGGEYDIIHIHHPDPMAALALRLSGYRGRVVLHWHSDIVSQQLFLQLYRPLQRWLIRRADRIVGTTPTYLQASPWLRDVQDKCSCIPIGIAGFSPDPMLAASIRARYPEGTLLLSVGRLVPYKGYSCLIEAMRHLPDSFHLVIGGTGPLEAQLRAQIEEEGLSGRITLAGYLSDADLPGYFGACDIFVLPSVMKTEAFGIVQIEAMSCGKPVVATRIPGSGVAWVNAEGISGQNAKPGDAEDLARAIREVNGAREKYASGALGRFQAQFTSTRMINNIKQLYETLV